MSAELFPTSDLRSASQDTKRAASKKHKWTYGAVQRVGNAPGQLRPSRPLETDGRTFKRRAPREVLASSARTKKVGRNPHMLESTAHAHSDDSSASNPDDADRTPSPPLDEGVVYSFDAARAPSQGSQIFTSALAKAVERFEDRETNQLVRNEYDVLNSEGETVGLTSGGKTKGTESAMRPLSAPDTDEEYEFV